MTFKIRTNFVEAFSFRKWSAHTILPAGIGSALHNGILYFSFHFTFRQIRHISGAMLQHDEDCIGGIADRSFLAVDSLALPSC